ncbi:hypothetical protein [Streptomyces californicus]
MTDGGEGDGGGEGDEGGEGDDGGEGGEARTSARWSSGPDGYRADGVTG